MFSTDKLMNRFFRKADNVVWDLMSGKIGVRTEEGIATLEGEGDDAQISINIIDQFGLPIPAFAQSTPVSAINLGDIIYFGAKDRPGWIIEKKGDPIVTFKLMKADGTSTTWKAPKVSVLGIEGGAMVLRSLMTMLPGGDSGLGALRGNLLPLIMMMDGDGDKDAVLSKMLPLMLMTQTGDATGGGMGNMMQMMMLMQMMKGGSGGNPFSDIFGGSEPKLKGPRFNN